MPATAWFAQGSTLPGAPGVKCLETTSTTWLKAAQELATAGGRLLALWASHRGEAGDEVYAAIAAGPGVLVLSLPRSPSQRHYPNLSGSFPAAGRMQRALRDLSGLECGDWDKRPWLRHAAWQTRQPPLAADPELPWGGDAVIDDYPFIRVEGDGVHEIAVGPVHAGIIEPGHFRFSVVGEKVLRLEQRLGYVHKGIEQRFQSLPVLQAHRLAARISGDSAVAYSWAYCQALEGIAGVTIPARAAHLRALALELERIANHCGDLGALGNDAGFAFGLTQFSRLKEWVLRATELAFGQRYLFDLIEPGGTRVDIAAAGQAALDHCLVQVVEQSALVRRIYDDHAGVRDRFVGTGIVAPALAAQLGLCGFAARASGQPFDLRVDLPCDPYTALEVTIAQQADGDVAARVAIRFDELLESCRLVRLILERLPPGPHQLGVPEPAAGALGIGLIEGWRGPVLVALQAGRGGAVLRCHPHDSSWQNWPVLEHAVIGNIVPDFPLINKSFNLSYSGHDL